MNIIELLITKLISMIVDFPVSLIIIFCIHRYSGIKNWGYKLLLSFVVYIIVAEILKVIMRILFT